MTTRPPEIRCVKCAAVFESPTDDDSFRALFSDFGSASVLQAETTGSAYLARKTGWVGGTGGIWMCPGCMKGAW